MAIPLESPLTLVNDSKPIGPEWWDWWIWLEGPAEELDRVEFVTYRLHPSFPRPVQKVADRATSFRLNGSGWGEFTVKATVSLRSGESVELERWLGLRNAESGKLSDSSDPEQHRPSVFISASAVDGDIVAELTEALREQGIDARREQDVLSSGTNIAAGIDAALSSADGVVAVFSEPRSPWVEEEFARGLELSKLTLPVVRGKVELPRAVTNMTRFELKERGSVQDLANRIAARLKDHLV
jgi:TIR domain/YEATS family